MYISDVYKKFFSNDFDCEIIVYLIPESKISLVIFYKTQYYVVYTHKTNERLFIVKDFEHLNLLLAELGVTK